MKTTAYLLLMSFVILSCNQKRQEHAELEKEYIENLEEKNRILERELKELKQTNKTKAAEKKEVSARAGATGSSNTEVQKPKVKTNVDYFTIGSTEDEVLDIMGDPTSITVYHSNWKVFHYSISSVEFKNGRVYSYSNLDDRLKVRVRR